eukprot:scaffold31425_cov94-Skeletonema_dohrnii-CCMP3373.AAC.2
MHVKLRMNKKRRLCLQKNTKSTDRLISSVGRALDSKSKSRRFKSGIGHKLSLDSSVGRAVDCSGVLTKLSIGHWFDSGSRDYNNYSRSKVDPPPSHTVLHPNPPASSFLPGK